MWQLIIMLVVSVALTFLIGLILWLSKRLNWTFVWVKEESRLFFFFIFLGLYFHFASFYYYNGFSDQLSSIAFFLITGAVVLGLFNLKKKT